MKLFEEEDRVVFIGGDHSISYSTVRAFVEKYGSDARIVIFDAHADCMPPMKEPTHEEWLRAVLERNGLKGEQVLLIGARDIEPEERGYLEKENVIMVEPKEVVNDLSGVKSRVEEFVKRGEVYVSFDIDVFDDSIVKATGYPVEEGLEAGDVSDLLNVVFRKGDVRGCDLVEVNLDFSEGDVDKTVYAARRVLEKFLE